MEITKAQQREFTRKLMKWHENENDRQLPWKDEKDPYKIWLSEIILQQTRAEQGLPYYNSFTEAYPSVADLAAANDEEVFRLWQGLGYYNRCKNLLATARIVSQEGNNKFPNTYEGLLALKGIGPYTAAAIASFAYDLPHAVVDGNVYRVLGRYFGVDKPYDSTDGKRVFHALAQDLLCQEKPGAYNQAIMDLGATVCTPASPKCGLCPLRSHCFAFNNNMISELPVKGKKVAVKKRYFHYLMLTNENRLWIRKRTEKDIWQNLYEPLLIEEREALDLEQLERDHVQAFNPKESGSYEGSMTQRLTHQIIESRFYTWELERAETMENAGEWVVFSDLKKYAFPKTLVSFLEKKLYF